MKFLLLCALIVVMVAANCGTYETQATCLDNCWCRWRTEVGYYNYENVFVVTHPSACVSDIKDCHYGTGAKCYWNNSTKCTVFSFVITAATILLAIVLFILAAIVFVAVVVLVSACLDRSCNLVMPYFVWFVNCTSDTWQRVACVRWVALILLIAVVTCIVYGLINVFTMFFKSDF